LGESLEDKVNPFFVVKVVEAFYHGSKSHLGNTVDNCGFHFKTVQVNDFLLTLHPEIVKTEWIDAVFIRSDSYLGFIASRARYRLTIDRPARFSNHNWHG